MPDSFPSFDIAICGTGPVGLTLAALLVRQGVTPERLVMLNTQPPERSGQSRSDPRSIALSYGSSQILQKIGAWPIAASAIEEIHISRRAHFGRTLLRCQDYGLPALGYVTRYSALVDALAESCTALGIRTVRLDNAGATIETDREVRLFLAAEQSITTKLVVQAEGGQFAEQTGKNRTRDYRQTALVAQVAVSAPLVRRAFERFTDEGPLALLPQHEAATQYALVWCMRAATAQRLMLLPDKDFLAALEQAFGNRLGRFLHATPRAVYPLGLNAGAPDTARSVAVGNAAQTLHPVAGQGLNLGLRDATVLARLLAQSATPATLANFLAERQRDRNLTIQLTDVMARIFVDGLGDIARPSPLHSLSQTLLGLSLGAIDGIAPIKRLLAQQMIFGSR
ncbi:MAG: FAD-dependent monooxygenase [Pseudomonadota bacterium]